MRVIIRAEKIRELMDTCCSGNYNKFARELGVNSAHLYRFLNTGVGGGRKMVGAVYRYCKRKGLKCESYIDM